MIDELPFRVVRTNDIDCLERADYLLIARGEIH
jgi:hypothetical protein